MSLACEPARNLALGGQFVEIVFSTLPHASNQWINVFRRRAVGNLDPPAIIDGISMYKLIGIILAALPVVLFLKAIMGQSRKRSQAVSDFKKQMDYVFWVIMVLVGCGVVYSLGKLLYEFVR